MATRKTSKKKTVWYVVNIKSRGIQTPETYVEAFEKLQKEDPLIHLRANRFLSIKSMFKSEFFESEGYVRSILVKLSAYDILDHDRFYNKRKKESVSLQLDPDIVANEIETSLIFVPRVHRFAIRTNSEISLNYVQKYFQEAFDKVMGKGSFDVTIVKDKDVVQRIISSYQIYSIKADLTFSNNDRSISGFQKVFDHKIREMNPTRFQMNIQGTSRQPLQAVPDGLIQAAANLSESNGYINARVREYEGSRISHINTNDYPLNMSVTNAGDDLNTATYNELINRFDNNEEIRDGQQ